ncbi:MAG: GNAT family N-acetyltransferase [Chloroflexota bacterium]
MASVAIARGDDARGGDALVIGETTDRALLRGFLERDRLFSAYALCDLEEREFRRTRWGIAREGAAVVALVLEYEGYSPQPLFAMGRPDGIAAILRDVIRPRIAYVAALPEQLPAIQTRYRVDAGSQMVRMWLDADRFRPVGDAGVVRLVPADAPELNRLYHLGFGSWLPPQAIGDGVYYGIRVRGRLVAAAGTHVIGRGARIAVVGNVLTRTEYRGRGFAKAVTSAVTAELLDFCDHVVLNVRSDNPPALNAYRHLGYTEHVRFEERLVHRLGGPWAELVAAVRRRLDKRRESTAS